MMVFKRDNTQVFPDSDKLFSSDKFYDHSMVLAPSGKGKSRYWETKVAEAKKKDPNCTVIDLENNPELKGLKPDAYYLGHLLREGEGKFKLPRGVEKRLYRHSLLISSKTHSDWAML